MTNESTENTEIPDPDVYESLTPKNKIRYCLSMELKFLQGLSHSADEENGRRLRRSLDNLRKLIRQLDEFDTLKIPKCKEQS